MENFLDPSKACGGQASTGIAFDGTNFLVSCVFNNAIGVFDANGNYVKTITIGPGGTSSDGTLIEDLSANYQQVLGPPTVPEPSSIASLALGLIGLGACALWRKKQDVTA